MQHRTLLRLCARIMIAVCATLPTSIHAQQVSTWDCLPDEVVGAIRVPDGMAVFDAMKATKFGQVMFTEQRKAALIEVCEKHSSEGWTKFKEKLDEYDLTVEDLIGLFAGETGYAVTISQTDEQGSAGMGLAWMQPGEELAAKFYEFLGKAIEDQDSEQPVTRVDLQLADQNVMQLRFPSSHTEYTEEFEWPEGYSDLTEEQQGEAWQQANEKHQESAVTSVKHRTALVCQLEDRLLIAHHLRANDEDEIEGADEQLSSLMANLLSAHTSGGVDGFAVRMAADPSVERTFSADGQPVIELLIDLQGILAIVREEVEDEEQADKWFRLFALDTLGPLAMRSTAESSSWRTNFALSLPAPRQGLMRLWDQELLEIDPPQWVPADTMRYFQFSFDLGQAYETIKEEVTREFPESSAAGFQMAETQVQNFAQVSLPELLKSLGNRHTILSLGVDVVDFQEDDLEDSDQGVTDRMALVWQLEDEQVWAKLLKVIAPFAGLAGGAEPVEEQGFTGYRMKNEQGEGGLFLGKGYLVLGSGEGVVETTLSALNNPPSGSNALRGSQTYANAGELLDLSPAMIVEITDNERYLRSVLENVNQQFDQLEAMMNAMLDEEDKADDGVFFFALMRALMPKGEELQNLLGVTVGRTEINEDGLFFESVQEMPLP